MTVSNKGPAGGCPIVRGGALSALIPAALRGFRLARAAFDGTRVRLTAATGDTGYFHVLDREAIAAWAQENEAPTAAAEERGGHANDLHALGNHAGYLHRNGGDQAVYSSLEFSTRDIEVSITFHGCHYVFTIPAGERDCIWPDAFRERLEAHPSILEYRFEC